MKSNQTKNPKAPAKPSITIYPTMELRGALETLAKECDRDLSSQCVAMLKQRVWTGGTVQIVEEGAVINGKKKGTE